jgi:hypothetical protein
VKSDKPRAYFRGGRWECYGQFVIGFGPTVEAAWRDMWNREIGIRAYFYGEGLKK